MQSTKFEMNWLWLSGAEQPLGTDSYDENNGRKEVLEKAVCM